MDFDASLSYLKVGLDKAINGRFPVDKGYIKSFVEKSDIAPLLGKLDKRKLTRHLETIYGTTQERGHTLNTDFKEWYPIRKVETKFYYWKRLHQHWLSTSALPVQVVQTIDTVTDEIIGYLGDPNDINNWRRRGLVMGHVQSGKTTNYSALISKAADVGYRIIVVLAGLTNSLRYQTQIRLDEAFVGKSSLGDDYNIQTYPVSYVLNTAKESVTARHPYCGTTQNSDFSVKTAKAVSASEGNFAEPILFVTKKNEKVLGRLIDWLQGLRQGSALEGPMLIIDDEADNASVNTSGDPGLATRINQRVRSLMQTSRRTSYVGYTATPFANIFIDPDTEDEMLENDLFPEHFIKSLTPPDNYIGASKLFSQESHELANECVKIIPDDYQDLLPVKHKSTHLLDELPDSLKEAVFHYLLVRAWRVANEDGDKHSSMLVNVSRFNAVQSQVHEHIYRMLHEVKSAVETWSNSSAWIKSETLKRMAAIWEREFQDSANMSWNEIRPVLNNALLQVEVRLVNMQGGGLDYTGAPKSGLHIIAVGGLALARGLTLEGLTTSYVLRNVGAADTLLQMGRWFGYRPGYEKLCRVHMTEAMYAHFTEINESVEELRHDLVVMEKQKKRPSEFGLKVRHSPTGIAITAANKMRTAEEIEVALDLSCHHTQAFEVYDSSEINKQNRALVDDFLIKIEGLDSVQRNEEEKALVWKSVPGELIHELVTSFQNPTTHFAVGTNSESLVSSYISERLSELSSWDIAIPFIASKSNKTFPYATKKQSYCRSRLSGDASDLDKGKVKITAKNVVADPNPNDLAYGQGNIRERAEEIFKNDGEIKWTEAYLRERENPILIIHIFDFETKDKKSQSKLSKADDLVVTLSIGFPETGIEVKPKKYAATARFLEILRKTASETESDEVIDDE